jgi:bacillopeptidase F
MGMGAATVIVLLGVATLVVGGNILVSVAGQLAGAFDGALAHISSAAPATPPPSGATLDTPTLDAPENDGYTNQAIAAISGSVPGAITGKDGYKVRVYAMGKDGSRRQVAEVAVGATTQFTTGAVELVEGPNSFAASILSPSGEGQPSPIVVFTLDTQPPPLSVTSPPDGSRQSTTTVAISGRTDAGATVSVRNRNSTGSGPGGKTAGEDGRFSITVALVAGTNTIDLTATDRAGNSTTAQLTLKRDYGQLAAHLSVSPVKFGTSTPATLKLSVQATSEDGSPLDGATVVYTVTVQGLGPIVSPELTTDSLGVAEWRVTISGAAAGVGEAGVLVTTPEGDQVVATVRLTTT